MSLEYNYPYSSPSAQEVSDAFGSTTYTPTGVPTAIPRSPSDRANDQVWIGDHCRGDGSDETSGILAAIQRLPLATGGYIHIDRPVTFATGISLDRPIHFVGEGSSRWNNSYRPRSRLIYSGAGPWAFDFGDATVPAARGSGFKDINVEYNNTGFTGNLIQSHVLGFAGYNSVFMGINASNVPIYTAASLVALGKAHSYMFESCHFDYAQRGIYIYDDGSGALPNHIRCIASHFDNLVLAGIDHDPTLGNILGACLIACVFNPIVLSRTHAQGQPVLGVNIKAIGFFIGGCNFVPSNFDTNAWADCALKINGGRGVVSGCKFSQSGTSVRMLSGHAVINGCYFDGAIPIQLEGGALQTNGNINAFYGRPFSVSTAVKKGDIVIPTTPNGFCYRALGDGTTGAAEPTWPAATAGTVVSGGVTYYGQPTACILGLTVDGATGPHIEAQGDEYPSGYSYSYYTSGQSNTNSGWVAPYTDGTTFGVDGDKCVALRPNSDKASPKTTNYIITIKDGSTQKLFTNTGAAGSVTFTLPDNFNFRTIMELEFIAYVAQPIVVQRGAATNVILGPAGSVTSLTSAGGIGNSVKLKYDHSYSTVGAWRVTGMVGTWT
jgi:hypothetical protein